MDDEPQDATAALAELLRTDEDTLARSLGRPWFELPKPDDEGVCFVNGTPAQVMVCLDPQRVVVGQPNLVWEGYAPKFVLGKVNLEATWDDFPTIEALADAARAAASARRRTFHWCRYCREQHDPGNLSEKDVCRGCAEDVLHVVH